MKAAYAILVSMVLQQYVVNSHNHEQSCPEDCSCMNTELKCRIPSYRAMPMKMFPPNTTVLDLSGNNILNIPSSSLTNMEDLVEIKLSGNKIYFLENGAFEPLDHLRKLCLKDNNIHFIEEFVFSVMPDLEEVSLEENHLSNVPNFSSNARIKSIKLSSNDIAEVKATAFSDLEMLEELCLKNNKLTSLNENGFSEDLTRFKSMNLAGNHMADFPNVIQKMNNLKNLSICYNPIKTIQANDFFPLTELEVLYMTGIGLTEFKTFANWLKKLRTLGMGKNKLTEHSLKNIIFPNLENMYLYKNPIAALLGDSFAGLPNLKILDLSFCEIKAIDYQAFKPLAKLKELNLSSNRLTTITAFINNLNLEKLDLSSNNITLIPRSTFRTLTMLEDLNLSNNSLSYLPSNAFGSKTPLKTLDLSFNQLMDVPVVISNMFKNLKSLNLSDNLIETLTVDDFLDLTELETLNLRGNKLTSIPEDVFLMLSSLQSLFLCRNKLDANSAMFKGLQNLTHLTMDKNEISNLGSETFHYIENVQTISMKNNSINHVSNKTFHRLAHLEELWFLFNDLREMPDLSKNSKLRVIGLCGNPIRELTSSRFCNESRLTDVLFRSMNLTSISEEAFPSLEYVKYLHLASNKLHHLPQMIHKMASLEVLHLSNNPIRFLSPRDFEGLPNLKELRLDNMKLTHIDVLEFFVTLPALRSVYLSGNPWNCNCQMQWYTLGIDGARARITTPDWPDLKCQSPPRLHGKKFDYLRLGDFRHCHPLQMRFVFETSVVISLPMLVKLSDRNDEVFNQVTYFPMGGGKKNVINANKQRELRISHLSPDTEYIICNEIIGHETTRLRKRHASESIHNHPLSLNFAPYDINLSPQSNVCIKVKTRKASSSAEMSNGNIEHNMLLDPDHLVIVYAVIGGAAAFALIITIVLTTIWCRRSHQHLSESISPFGNITDDTINQDQSQSEPNFHNQSKPSNRVVEEGDLKNGKALEMTSGVDNEACDVTASENPIRTKL